MRLLLMGVVWIITSLASAAIAIVIGYGVAWVVTGVISILLSFLWVIGALIGLGVGCAAGGAIAGLIVGGAQNLVLSTRFTLSRDLVWTLVGAWAIAGLLSASTVVPVSKGDVAPLLIFVVTGAMMAGFGQWLVLWHHQVRGAAGWALSGTIGTIPGGIAGLMLLGAFNGYSPPEILVGASTSYESVTEVQAIRLVEFDEALLLFVSVEDAYQNTRWELWRSDGTEPGTT